MSQPSRGGSPAEPAALPESFEQAIAELEQLVATMEAGALSLEASLAAYRRGAVLAKYCQERLASAEQQVRVLEGDMLKSFRTADSEDDA